MPHVDGRCSREFSNLESTPLEDTVTFQHRWLSADLVRAWSTRVGTTAVRGTGGSEVRVQATRPLLSRTSDLRSDCARLWDSGGGSRTCNRWFVRDYVIDTPSALGADVRSASGPCQ